MRINVSNTFRSERLVFRAVEDNDEDLDFLVKLTEDHDALSHTNSSIFVPMSRKNVKKWREEDLLTNKTLFSAIVCLPEEEQTAATTSTTEGETRLTTRPALKAPARSFDTAGTWEALSTTPNPSKPKPTPIGVVCLSGAHEPEYSHHRYAGALLWISAEYQGKGYGSEALRWLTNWGFRMANLHRIELHVFGWNTEAPRLYERLGFVSEGRERETVWFNGKYHDVLEFSMLEHEWRNIQEKWDAEKRTESGVSEGV